MGESIYVHCELNYPVGLQGADWFHVPVSGHCQESFSICETSTARRRNSGAATRKIAHDNAGSGAGRWSCIEPCRMSSPSWTVVELPKIDGECIDGAVGVVFGLKDVEPARDIVVAATRGCEPHAAHIVVEWPTKDVSVIADRRQHVCAAR